MRIRNCHEIVLELFNVSHTKNNWAASEYTFPYCIVYSEFIVKRYRQKVPGRPNHSDFEVHILLTFDVNGGRETLTKLATLGHMAMAK